MLRPVALVTLLAALGVVPVAMSESMAPPAAAAVKSVDGEGPFHGALQVDVGGRAERLILTGTAVRKALGLKFYQIAAYCDDDHAPRDVDAMAAADVPKRLILIMEKNISENILRRSFEQTFNTNDPEKKYVGPIQTLLDHVAAKPLSKGDRVTLTHLPRVGIQCQVCDAEPIVVSNPSFAHVVWNVYMGPKGVSPDLRKGLGARLNTRAAE